MIDSIQEVSERLQAEGGIATAETTTTENVATTESVETPATETSKEGTDTKAAVATEVKKEEPKELSDDELLSLLQKRGIKLPEEKQKTEDEEEADFLSFATKEGKLKMDDYVEAKKLKDIENSKLVKDNFAAQLRSKNKNISQEDIDKKFDRKFGDEVMDETDNPKVVYDEDEIKAEADKIRESKFAPINNVKNEFSEVSKRLKFESQVEKEFVKDIEPKITDKVVMKHGNAEYTIDLDKDFVSQIKQQVKTAFQSYKQNPEQFGNQFVVDDVVKFLVKTSKFDDIAEVIAKQRSSDSVLEALKPFKNPVEGTKERDTTPHDGESMTKAATEMGEQLRKFV